MRYDALLQTFIGFLLGFCGVVAVMLDALPFAIALWVCTVFCAALALRSYGKQVGWHRWSIRRRSLSILVVGLLAILPLYWHLRGNIEIELSPHVIVHATSYKVGGDVMRHSEYGFGVIARIHKTGKATERIHALEVLGEIDADANDYWRTLGESITFEQVDSEYGKRKPYYRVSFISFPINTNKVEAGDEFIRFLFLDPTNGSTQAILRSGDVGLNDYFGFRGENPSPPRITTTVPNISSFVNFMGYERRGAGNGQLLSPRLREEIKSGRLKFILKLDSGLQVIDPQKITIPTLVSLEDWKKQTPQDVFFRNNLWDRTLPVEKDPIPERLQ